MKGLAHFRGDRKWTFRHTPRIRARTSRVFVDRFKKFVRTLILIHVVHPRRCLPKITDETAWKIIERGTVHALCEFNISNIKESSEVSSYGPESNVRSLFCLSTDTFYLMKRGRGRKKRAEKNYTATTASSGGINDVRTRERAASFLYYNVIFNWRLRRLKMSKAWLPVRLRAVRELFSAGRFVGMHFLSDDS